jgi:hypothetical protein
MGLQFRRRTRGKRAWLNFSKSGVSLSVKPHSRVTLNSRGGVWVRLMKGVFWRS